MKQRRLSLVFLAFCFAGILLTGCDNGNRDPVVATPVLGVVQFSLTASGPAGCSFPASGYELQLSSVSDKNGSKSSKVTGNNGVLSLPALTLADVTPGQFLVQLFPTATDPAWVATNPNPLYRAYFVGNFSSGEVFTASLNLTSTDTSKAYAYDSWSKKSKKTSTSFLRALQASLASQQAWTSNSKA
ncbi:MAG: hypothetical protein WA705_05885 [Candidatus Ozemobacteraceae bacterium]